MKMYEVGGCVRDEILGVRSKDIDFSVVLEQADIDAYSAHNKFTPFEYMVFYLQGMGFKIFLETPEHLTVRAQFPKFMSEEERDYLNEKHPRRGLTADFVLARKESGYSDGRRPDRVEPGTLIDDLARRDFTMNAIAKDAEGNLIDPFNGQQDIERKIIRAVGDPLMRLTEDALRAVRALRFSVTKGFSIEKELATAMQAPSVIDSLYDNISDERIMDELSKALRYDTKATIFLMTHHFPILTGAVLGGKVSFDATMKQKGRGR